MGYVYENAKQIKEAINILSTNVTDDIALQAYLVYPKWSKDLYYAIGARVLYNNVLYKCITEHTGQEDWNPQDAVSLWTKVLIPNEDSIPEWEQPDSTNGYMIGNKVTHNDKIWISLVDNNVWEPGATGTETLWKEALE